MTLIKTALIVSLAVIPVQLRIDMSTKALTKDVIDGSKIQENLRNLLDSITKNDVRKTDSYRGLLKEGAVREQQAFDVIKGELRFVRQKDANKQTNLYSKHVHSGGNVEKFKRKSSDEEDDKPVHGDKYDMSKSDRAILTKAVKENNLEAVKQFFKENNSTKFKEDDGADFLHLAAKNGHLDMVKYFMEEPIFTKLIADSYYTKPTKLHDHTLTVLDDAIVADSLDIIKYLLDKSNVNLYEAKDFERTLSTMIAFGRLNLLKYFIEDRNIDSEDPCKWISEPLIFKAIRSKHRNVIDYLINEEKVNLEERNFLNENILFPAVDSGNLAFLKHLLDEKKMDFDINWTNMIGRTVVYLAVAANDMNMLKYLVDEKKADVNIPRYTAYGLNKTCLHKAYNKKNYEMCEYLISRGAIIEDKSTYGYDNDKSPFRKKVIKLIDTAIASRLK